MFLKILNKAVLLNKMEEGNTLPATKRPIQLMKMLCVIFHHFLNTRATITEKKSTTKYLGPELNIAKMYNLYLDYCKENNVEGEHFAKKWFYRKVFNARFNLSFKAPEVDVCDTRNSFPAQLKGRLDPIENDQIKTEYDTHLTESKQDTI